tara:strand:+ start:2662 stop:2901 length:240 start_codon:yes stop_codon:yes gene_type:complete
MYICNCNGLNERDVDEAICAGVERCSQVYAFHGCRAECGKCLPEIRARMQQTKSSVSIANAPVISGPPSVCTAEFAGAD